MLSSTTGEVLWNRPGSPTKAAIADCQKRFADEEKALKLQWCQSRYRYRNDGTDNPDCAKVPPNADEVKAAKQICKDRPTASYCDKVITTWPPTAQKVPAKE